VNAATTRRLLSLHPWAGLILSLNVLLFAVTGLLLIFHEEIDELVAAKFEPPAAAQPISLSQAIGVAQSKYTGSHAVYVSRDLEHPQHVYVGLSREARTLEDAKPFRVDLASGQLDSRDLEESFVAIVFRLHAQLLAGPIGSIVVGVVGLAMLLVLVTGAVVYGPMMKKFVYGTLRRDKHRRNLLADVHKLLGVSTFGWLALVVATGILLSFGGILLQLYSQNELRALSQADQGAAVVEGASSIDEAVHTAERGAAGRRWTIAILPGSDLSSPRRFSILLSGTAGLDKRMLSISLVDASNPSAASWHELPLYLKALLVSEPLHFGDYGGLPLRLLWALFTVALIVLAGSGVYTFFAGRQSAARNTTEPLELSGSATTREAAE
jgi:uncharacterized iron-regulated membrane protein